MILIKKFPAPSDLETLKKEAEEKSIKNTGQKFADAGRFSKSGRRFSTELHRAITYLGE